MRRKLGKKGVKDPVQTTASKPADELKIDWSAVGQQFVEGSHSLPTVEYRALTPDVRDAIEAPSIDVGRGIGVIDGRRIMAGTIRADRIASIHLPPFYGQDVARVNKFITQAEYNHLRTNRLVEGNMPYPQYMFLLSGYPEAWPSIGNEFNASVPSMIGTVGIHIFRQSNDVRVVRNISTNEDADIWIIPIGRIPYCLRPGTEVYIIECLVFDQAAYAQYNQLKADELAEEMRRLNMGYIGLGLEWLGRTVSRGLQRLIYGKPPHSNQEPEPEQQPSANPWTVSEALLVPDPGEAWPSPVIEVSFVRLNPDGERYNWNARYIYATGTRLWSHIEPFEIDNPPPRQFTRDWLIEHCRQHNVELPTNVRQLLNIDRPVMSYEYHPVSYSLQHDQYGNATDAHVTSRNREGSEVVAHYHRQLTEPRWYYQGTNPNNGVPWSFLSMITTADPGSDVLTVRYSEPDHNPTHLFASSFVDTAETIELNEQRHMNQGYTFTIMEDVAEGVRRITFQGDVAGNYEPVLYRWSATSAGWVAELDVLPLHIPVSFRAADPDGLTDPVYSWSMEPNRAAERSEDYRPIRISETPNGTTLEVMFAGPYDHSVLVIYYKPHSAGPWRIMNPDHLRNAGIPYSFTDYLLDYSGDNIALVGVIMTPPPAQPVPAPERSEVYTPVRLRHELANDQRSVIRISFHRPVTDGIEQEDALYERVYARGAVYYITESRLANEPGIPYSFTGWDGNGLTNTLAFRGAMQSPPPPSHDH